MESAEYPHTMGSTLGANFAVRWLEHWTHGIVD